MTEHVEIDVTASGVQKIRINRPEKKNALTAEMYAALAGALRQARDDDAIRVSLILGVPGVFSAGNDIADFLKFAETGKRGSTAVFDFLEQIIIAAKPVVAGVDGLAIGVGTTMLLHCDFVVASERSLFKTPFVDLGLLPEAGSSLIGPRIMGHQRAFALLVMGEDFSPAQAQSAGFVTAIVKSEELENTALAAAEKLAAKPVEALTIARRLIRGERNDVLARMREETEHLDGRLRSDEARQAFMAFMSKGKSKAS
jgi:enoyl-CoA hydratase/carnithine racemase